VPHDRRHSIVLKCVLVVFNCINLFISQEYRILFEESGNNPGDKTLEDKFFEHEVSNAGSVGSCCCLTDLTFRTVDYSPCSIVMSALSER